jgi:hypothetical protein
MVRGGRRDGAGRKATWAKGETKTIRVPVALAEELLRIAHLLDENKTVDDVTKSKHIDLSGVPVQVVNDQSAVLLKNLIKAGFKIRPFGLQDSVRRQMDKQGYIPGIF